MTAKELDTFIVEQTKDEFKADVKRLLNATVTRETSKEDVKIIKEICEFKLRCLEVLLCEVSIFK